MKVEELIKLLHHFDPELEVYVEFFCFSYSYAPAADLKTMTLTEEEIEMDEGFDTKQVVVITF